MLLSRRFHLQKSDLFRPRTIKHSGKAAKRNCCNLLIFYSKMHLGTEIKDKVVVQRTCFSKVGLRTLQLPYLELKKEFFTSRLKSSPRANLFFFIQRHSVEKLSKPLGIFPFRLYTFQVVWKGPLGT